MSQLNGLDALVEQSSQIKKDSLVYKRIQSLFDEGTFVELDTFAKFSDHSTGVVTGYGLVDGATVFAFCQDSDVAGGAISCAQCAKIKKVYELAAKVGVPVVGIYDSVGAYLSEGAKVMSAFGDLLAAINKTSGVVPQISVIAGVCAGSAAILAAEADFVYMNKNGQFFLSAPFVTNAMGEKVEGAGSAENATKAGVVNGVFDSCFDAIAAAKKLVGMLPLNNLSEAPYTEYEQADHSAYLNGLANGVEYVGADVIAAVVDENSSVILSEEFGKNSITAFATMGGQVVGAVSATGRLDKDDCAKIAKFVSACDSFSIPVITFVNSDGFKESAVDELAGAVRDAARVAHVYANATTAKVAVITGDAQGPAYVALGTKGSASDICVAWPNAFIAPVSAKAAVNILKGEQVKASSDPKAEKEAQADQYTADNSAFAAAANGDVDAVVAPADTRATLLSVLDMLSGKRVSTLPKKHGNMPL